MKKKPSRRRCPRCKNWFLPSEAGSVQVMLWMRNHKGSKGLFVDNFSISVCPPCGDIIAERGSTTFEELIK